MDADLAELVRAYWRHHALTQGEPADHLAADEQGWAVETVNDAIDDDLPGVIQLLADVLAAPEADPVAFGRGPLEDLLALQPRHADAVMALCRQDGRWREALAAVDLDDDERDELEPLWDLLPSGTLRP